MEIEVKFTHLMSVLHTDILPKFICIPIYKGATILF